MGSISFLASVKSFLKQFFSYFSTSSQYLELMVRDRWMAWRSVREGGTEEKPARWVSEKSRLMLVCYHQIEIAQDWRLAQKREASREHCRREVL